MPGSVIDQPAEVIISQEGRSGANGANGANGTGLNSVEKIKLDNPIVDLYKKNRLVSVITNFLEVDRPVGGSYTDIYGDSKAALADEPRQEGLGWLLTSDETHSFQTYDNIPLLDNGFSVIVDLGSYSENSPSQNILAIPSTTGVLFSIGSNAAGNWEASLRGSGLVEYKATSLIPVGNDLVVATYKDGQLDFYVNGVLIAITSLPTNITDALNKDGKAIIGGDYSVNIKSIKIYDFALTADQITYITGI